MNASAARRWTALGDPASFAAALATRPLARSEHFMLHRGQLSTSGDPAQLAVVDEVPRVGLVVPKRHARRAATRNLIRRQVRSAFDARGVALAGGAWVLRLRSPFDPKRFPSAASAALRQSVREELDRLLKAL